MNQVQTIVTILCFLVAGASLAISDPVLATNQDNELAGTSWQLVRFQGADQVLTPDDKAKYTLAFGSDGRVSARVDCNRGAATWKSASPGKIEFGPLALTRAMCPPGSMHDHIARNWSSIRSYVIKDRHLFLTLIAGGGKFEYEPLEQQTVKAGKSPVASKGPFTFDCLQGGTEGGSITATFYETKPALVLIDRVGQIRPAFQVPAASGSKFEGADISFREAKGEATVNWSGTELKCKRR